MTGPTIDQLGACVVEKLRHGGERDGERVFYAIGPQRRTLEAALRDLRALEEPRYRWAAPGDLHGAGPEPTAPPEPTITDQPISTSLETEDDPDV